MMLGIPEFKDLNEKEYRRIVDWIQETDALIQELRLHTAKFGGGTDILVSAKILIEELQAENARLIESLSDIDRQTSEIASLHYRIVPEDLRLVLDHVKGIAFEALEPKETKDTQQPDEPRFVVVTIAYDKYTGQASRWGIIDNDNNHYLADGESDDPTSLYSHVERTYHAWEFLRRDSAQAKADELNAQETD